VHTEESNNLYYSSYIITVTSL